MAAVRRAELIAMGSAVLTLIACAPGGSSPKPSPSPSHRPSSTPSATASVTPQAPQPLHFQVQPAATGLEVPWELGQGPNGLWLVTERMNGQVRVFQGGQLQPGPALSVQVAAGSGVESGLLGLALHPGFPNPPLVYLYYTYQGASGGKTNRVSRFTWSSGKLTGEQVLVDGIPGGTCCHFGGRIAFGPDGDLYVTVGDGQQPQRAEDVSSPNGKVLRLGDDGSPATGNPFPGSRVYAYGFRNPQGLAWDPAGHLYVSDNGPTGEFGLFHHDEIDQVTSGGYYGWPLYAGNLATGQQATTQLPNPVPPVVESGNDTWAPSGMTFYAPTAEQQPTLLVGTLLGQAVRRFIIDPANPGHLLSQEVALNGYGRIRDVVATQDHCILVLTSNRDGRGTPQADDDRVLRACPG
jgi:glucose/arabinose dehydrogenase